MALTVEDGTGLADADSLVSLAFALAYHTKRGNTLWTTTTATVTDAAREIALIKATEFFEKRWGLALTGTPLVETQALSLPRENGYRVDGLELADDEVWVGVQRAVCEYALRSLSAPLWPDPVVDSGGAVTQTRKKIGELETETHYSETKSASRVPVYTEADALVAPYLRTVGGGSYR